MIPLGALNKLALLREFQTVLILGISHILTLCLGLAATVVWTRWMPQEMFGQFKVIMGITSFVGAFCLIGTGQVAVMSSSGGADGNLKPLNRKKIAANLFGALLIALAAGYYYFSRESSKTLALGLLTAAFIFPLYNINDVWSGWLNGKGRFGYLSMGRLFVSFSSLASILLLALLQVEFLWMSIVLLFTITSAFNFVMYFKALSFRVNKHSDDGLIRYGRHITFAMMFTSLLALDVVILEYYFSPEEVALYAVSLVIPGLLKTVFGIIWQVVSPRIYASNSPATLWPELKKKFFLLTLFFVIAGLIGFFLIPKIVNLLFSERYSEAGQYSRWLWLTTSCLGTTMFLGSALLATRRALYTYVPNVGHPIFLISLYFAFIDFGAGGFIVARCVSAIILAVYYVYSFRAYISR